MSTQTPDEKRPTKNPNAVRISAADPDKRREVRRAIIDLDHYEKPPGATSGAPLPD